MEKVVVLGTGPAGLTAAIYLARAKLEPLIVDGSEPGGQLMITSEVENFPGFPEGIGGPELMERCRRQAERFGARFRFGRATAVELRSKPLRITLEEGEGLEAEALIISTGASARWLGLPSEKALRGAGVSACATCDGFFFQDKDVLVVGGGDTAIEEGLFLTRFARRVTIVHRRDELRASKYMQERARRNEKISFRWNSVVEEIRDVAAGRVTGVVVRDVQTNERNELAGDGVFIAIGHKPNTELFAGQLDLDENGYLVARPPGSRTRIPGVFACGDVADHRYRQAITAAGSGCMAAVDAERYLGGEPWE
ncbi:MAG: thioredoxin-disulfide reductase [Candidatus Eisenbacteria bacterium]|uniref:Thioredoxin reductase n=1 Tax=Eiseniibacteriota bacterium TaxID=2212470 RepID=A0A937X969_UNCEI|nr:thioredoxin-disulfide reductase [Candidatus Eisenbacteria bacterium]